MALPPSSPDSDSWLDASASTALPSWMLSVTLHVLVILLLLSLGGRGSGSGPGDGADGEGREVALYPKPDESAESEGQAGPAAAEQADATPASETTAVDAIPEDRPAIKPDLPARSLLGPGPGATLPLPNAGKTAARSGDGGLPRETDGGGGGLGFGTQFFEIDAQGARFVYVIDCSGSMSNQNAIGVARAELMSSLQKLDSKQQFQIIFYSTRLRPMPHAEGRQTLVRATEINHTLARQFINSVQPDGGTDHMIALKAALALKPEVIFFLTDAQEPQLTAGELNEVQELNKGRAKIHAIEFGKGPPLGTPNFLQKLASRNGGSYRYRDIMSFRRGRSLD